MPKSTKITEEQAKQKFQELYPKAKFTFLKYEKANEAIEIKCENCGKLHKFARLSSATARINFCSCSKEFNNTKEKVVYLLEKNNFSLLEWNGSGKKLQIKCNNCGKISYRYPNEILRNPEYCKDCNDLKTTPLNIEEVQYKIDNIFGKGEYQLLSYKNWKTKVGIKHLKCKTIFKQNIGHFLEGCGCPKCNRKRSKGEQLISKWLEIHLIKYKNQYIIKYEDNSYGYIDFFIPYFNLAIEYNDEQHYQENNFYNQKEDKKFQTQRTRDEKKRKYCKDNNIDLLEIPYWHLKKISSILSSRFNDYYVGTSVSKYPTSKDEDIV